MNNFYSESFSESYRLGDILQGFTNISTINLKQNDDMSELVLDSINFQKHNYYVILTPCCSIENKEAILAPLKKLDPKLLFSDYIVENFLRVNEKMAHRDAMGEDIYKKQYPKEEDRINRDNSPPNYEHWDKFIYAPIPHILPEYELSLKKNKSEKITLKINHYMISFKDVFKVNSNTFDRGCKDTCTKIMELNPISRDLLRKKLSGFYARIPDEDREFLD